VNAREGPDEPPDVRTLGRVRDELLQLEREIVELQYVRRADAFERVRDAVRRLGEVGSPAGILDRAADELGAGSQFDRVLIGEVADGRLHARAIWAREDRGGAQANLAQLQRAPIRLEYPLIEDEVVRRQGAEIVTAASAGTRTPARLRDVLGWEAYVVVALTSGGTTIGLLHADAASSQRALDELDREVAARYSEGLAGVFERAVLRETLQRHRDELQSAIRWMSARLSRLTADAAFDGAGAATGSPTVGAVDALTARELDVLRLMARGKTNGAIASVLVVGEGTVKYHVKNILRKLGATSRADAVARYVRANEAQR
jgi:LuxR family transcriptional regulator, regulator of acetate metabolism